MSFDAGRFHLRPPVKALDVGQADAISSEGGDGGLGLHGHRVHAGWLMTAGLFALLLVGIFVVVQ